MGSKPGGSNFEQVGEAYQPVPVQTETCENVKQGTKSSVHSVERRRVIEVSIVDEEAADNKEENSGDVSVSNSSDSVSSNDKEEEDDEDDELRRRVEEFIEKVNSGWKAELRRTSQLV